jgi:glycosyltransferase involved in cell wall biosynthesis
MVRTGIALRTALRSHRASLVHSQLYIADVLARLFTPAGVPLLTTLQSTDPWWDQRYRLRSRAKTALDAWTGRFAGTRYVAVSGAVRDKAVGALGLEGGRLRVIPNAIRVEKFRVHREWQRRGSVLIQVGRLDQAKDHATALRAFRLVKDAVQDAELIFVGDGPLRGKLESLGVELGLSGSVTFAGETDNVVEELRRATVFWMPSKWEGQGIACVEAMATGLPVVASNVGGLREVVVDRETGSLVPVGDFESLARQTLELLRDMDRQRAMGDAGRARAERLFNLDLAVARYIEAYNDLREGKW